MIRSSNAEEKRRLEAKIKQLEEELDDEQNNSEQYIDKIKKMQFDFEKMTTDLAIEKSNASKADVSFFLKSLPNK